jgi:small basic protein (TIGR04137 family)
MSLDKSLKTSGATSMHRNVLTRAERIAKLKEEMQWTDDMSAHGLVKVSHRKIKVGSKSKKKAAGDEAEGDAAETPAA